MCSRTNSYREILDGTGRSRLDGRLQEPPRSLVAVPDCGDEYAELVVEVRVRRVGDDVEAVEERIAQIEVGKRPGLHRDQRLAGNRAHPPAHDVGRVGDRAPRARSGCEDP